MKLGVYEDSYATWEGRWWVRGLDPGLRVRTDWCDKTARWQAPSERQV